MTDVDPDPTSPRFPALRLLVFCLVAAVILVVGSERIFWYWTPNPLAHLELTLFYAFPAAGAFGAIAYFRVAGRWRLLLVATVYAYLATGILTPVLYEGGVVPALALFFIGWHGLVTFYVLLYQFRRWLLDGAWRPLLAASAAIGLLWGLWSIRLLLPENVDDPDLVADQGSPLQLLEPGAFTLYALGFTAVLALGHWLLGLVWPRSFRPPRWLAYIWVLLNALMLLLWSTFIPWALPLVGFYLGLQAFALFRSRPDLPLGGKVSAGERTYQRHGDRFFDELAGPIPVAALWPLVAIPIVAAPTYGLLWALDLSEETIRNGVRWPVWIAVAAVALGLLAPALFKGIRGDSDDVSSPEPAPDEESV